MMRDRNIPTTLKSGITFGSALAMAIIPIFQKPYGFWKIGMERLRRHRQNGGVPSTELTELKAFMILIGE